MSIIFRNEPLLNVTVTSLNSHRRSKRYKYTKYYKFPSCTNKHCFAKYYDFEHNAQSKHIRYFTMLNPSLSTPLFISGNQAYQ